MNKKEFDKNYKKLSDYHKCYYDSLNNRLHKMYSVYADSIPDIFQLIKDYSKSRVYISSAVNRIARKYKLTPIPSGLPAEQQIMLPKNFILDQTINKASHYNDGKIEVINFIEDKKLGFNLGNCIKYISRAGKKDPTKIIEDLQKAEYYLKREINNLKNK